MQSAEWMKRRWLTGAGSSPASLTTFSSKLWANWGGGLRDPSTKEPRETQKRRCSKGQVCVQIKILEPSVINACEPIAGYWSPASASPPSSLNIFFALRSAQRNSNLLEQKQTSSAIQNTEPHCNDQDGRTGPGETDWDGARADRSEQTHSASPGLVLFTGWWWDEMFGRADDRPREGGGGASQWDGSDPAWLLSLKGWMQQNRRRSGL